jgi:hypothetical protein
MRRALGGSLGAAVLAVLLTTTGTARADDGAAGIVLAGGAAAVFEPVVDVELRVPAGTTEVTLRTLEGGPEVVVDPRERVRWALGGQAGTRTVQATFRAPGRPDVVVRDDVVLDRVAPGVAFERLESRRGLGRLLVRGADDTTGVRQLVVVGSEADGRPAERSVSFCAAGAACPPRVRAVMLLPAGFDAVAVRAVDGAGLGVERFLPVDPGPLLGGSVRAISTCPGVNVKVGAFRVACAQVGRRCPAADRVLRRVGLRCRGGIVRRR